MRGLEAYPQEKKINLRPGCPYLQWQDQETEGMAEVKAVGEAVETEQVSLLDCGFQVPLTHFPAFADNVLL